MNWLNFRNLIPLFGIMLLLGMAMSVMAQEETNEAPPADTAEEATPSEATPSEATPGAEAEEEETPVKAEPSTTDVLAFAIDNIMLLICAVLVLFMQAGFAMLEAGLNSAKNTVNILFKNVMDLSVGILLFFAVGFGLMYPGAAFEGGYFGFGGSGISEFDASTAAAGTLHPQVDFLFQVAFAATAATIVSGAVAGRMKFGAYLIYSAILTGLIYPVSGMWHWGGGFLMTLGGPDPAAAGEYLQGFHDFAGSIIVHAVGGFAGLAGAIVLGPRIGRFVKGKAMPMPGHNLTFAALGVFILWVGWYGFNPGSQLAFSSTDDISATMLIAVNTTLSPAAGAICAMITAWVLFKKPDLTMALNGALAGLVGITANCDCVTNISAIIIGSVAGVLVVMGIIALDKLKIDDPVGAFPVHGLCGVWGGLATGIFGADKIFAFQLIGTLAMCGWAFVTMFGVFSVLKVFGLLRVSPEEEQTGLDYSEHGMHAYPPNLVNDGYGATSLGVKPVGEAT
ncbi:MAG: Amt family ammonium transporter [Pirellulaceae bacterium]|jgi:Amt family ammonium transporter